MHRIHREFPPDIHRCIRVLPTYVMLGQPIDVIGLSRLTIILVHTQLYSAIPYGCATVTLVAINIISDRVNKKGPFLVGCLTCTCLGYIILIAVESVHVKIFATCLVASGIYPSVILLASWLGINTGGYTKRARTWG